MYKIFTLVIILSLTGCGNLSPRQEQEQKINNAQGKIGEVENLANSLKGEVGNLKSQSEIQNSKLDKIQQGLSNIQNINENTGVQILSGNGGLIISLVAIFGLVMLTLHYKNTAGINRETSEILTRKLIELDNPEIEDQVFQLAMFTKSEENVLNLVKKHRNLNNQSRS